MMRALLVALWQSDTAFPNGGFAFSNGVEGSAAMLGGLDRAVLASLVETALSRRWATSDRPALLHAFHAADLGRLAEIDHAYDAAAIPELLRSGSARNGRAFLTAHARLGTPDADALRDAITVKRCIGHLPVAQGWIWRRIGLTEEGAMAASAYASAVAMTNAAVRLGALGALDAQGVISGCLPLISELSEAPFDPGDPIVFASAAPWLDIAIMRQALTHLRLFSN
jgi:urease accessory protein